MKKIVSSDGSATLHNKQYDQTYHSVHGAVTESELVYLHYSGARSRLEHGLDCRVLEIGFGLALNFLLTARYALRTSATLHYTAFENAPISAQTFNSLDYSEIAGLEPLTPQVADLFQGLQSKPSNSLTFNQQIHLEVFTSNALDISVTSKQYDVIYLDAFSPETNPELWSPMFLEKLFRALKPGGTVSTYCVKGSVRRSFIEAGFNVEKLPGPPGKREVLRAFIT